MTVPGTGPKSQVDMTAAAYRAGAARQVPKSAPSGTDVATMAAVDKAEISAAARALAEVVMNDKPSLQLSSENLRALAGES